MTPLWREQAVHAIDVALAEAIYSLAVLPALIQRQTDVPASPTKLLGGSIGCGVTTESPDIPCALDPHPCGVVESTIPTHSHFGGTS